MSDETTKPLPAPDPGADRPIFRRADDLLNRGNFATSVARGIAARKGKESYVIGLYGSWGSGKSSVKNMIIEALQESETDCPAIVEFNPWQFKDADQLMYSFFNEMGEALNTQGSGTEEQKQERADKMKKWGRALTLGGAAISGAARIGGFVLPGMTFVQAVGDTVGSMGGQVEKKGEASEVAAPSLSSVRAELRELMRGLERPVLVVMDDIDRLSAEEMALVFQLVKVNGDFPNLVYLLLFQRDIVEAGLDKIAPNNSGADYLEKIIQLGLNIPTINYETLLQLLRSEVNQILGSEAHDLINPLYGRSGGMGAGLPYSNPSRALLSYFETMRDVRRFVNAFEFQANSLKKAGHLQANHADFLAVEVLRVFEPAVYNAIASNKGLFTIQPLTTVLDKGASARDQLNVILNKAKRRDAVFSIIKEHFPNLEAAIKKEQPIGQSREGYVYRANLSVACRDCFDRYFQLSLPDNELSDQEAKGVERLLTDQDALVKKIMEINTRGLFPDLITRWTYREGILQNEEQVELAFLALAEAADHLPSQIYKASEWELAFISKKFTSRWSEGEYVEFALKCAKDSNNLYMPCCLLMHLFVGLSGRRNSLNFLTLRPDANILLNEVTSMLRERLNTADISGQLARHPQRLQLLRFLLTVEAHNPQRIERLLVGGIIKPNELFDGSLWDSPDSSIGLAVLNHLNSIERNDRTAEELHLLDNVIHDLNNSYENGTRSISDQNE